MGSLPTSEPPKLRLVIGGLDCVFEIGRNFRNEGIDLTHNPEQLVALGTGCTGFLLDSKFKMQSLFRFHLLRMFFFFGQFHQVPFLFYYIFSTLVPQGSQPVNFTWPTQITTR